MLSLIRLCSWPVLSHAENCRTVVLLSSSFLFHGQDEHVFMLMLVNLLFFPVFGAGAQAQSYFIKHTRI